MSLVQRVTPIEGNDRELPHLLPAEAWHLRYKPSRSLRRVISYDAIPLPAEESQATHPTGGMAAYKVSTVQRVAQVVVTVLVCWLASGIVFGFAALKPVLVAEGVYREFCSAEELEADVEICFEQDLRLNFFFAVASTTCNVSALPVGSILDRYGSRLCAMLGSICLAAGSILMASAFAIPDFDGYVFGNVFLALGGTFIFVPSFQIANAFPKWSGAIVALVTGAFDASAAVFLLYRLAYEASEGVFTPQKFFLTYLIVPVIIIICEMALMNPGEYKTVPQLEEKIDKNLDATRDVHDSDDDLSDDEVGRRRERRRDHRESQLAELNKLLGDFEERQVRMRREEDRQAASGVWGALHGKTAWQQMLSPWFILMTLLTVLQMLRMNFFIATIRSQYKYLLNSEDLARSVNAFFDVALPVGGVASTPLIALLLDNVSTASTLTVLVTLVTACGIVGSFPYLWAAFANVVLFVVLRPLYYSAMSDYAVKVFGFATFGRVYGTIICFSGLVNLLQPLIDAANHEIFHDNPIPINTIMASLGCMLGCILILFVWAQGRRASRKQNEMREVTERDRLIPEVDEESNYDC